MSLKYNTPETNPVMSQQFTQTIEFGEKKEIEKLWMRYTLGGMSGLVKRRKAELNLYFK